MRAYPLLMISDGSPDQRFRRRRAAENYVVSALVPAVAWWSLMGWDTRETVGSDGNLHGPYEAWQVVSLVIVLVALGVWQGARASRFVAQAVATVALVASYAISARLDRHDAGDGLWLLGVLILCVVSLAGLIVVCAVSGAIRPPGGLTAFAGSTWRRGRRGV